MPVTTTDMLGRELHVPKHPKRIISLVPSQTELLAYLGLEEEVVGITLFCIHPSSWFQSKTRVGGTKKVNFDKVRELQPDLIIANKEENTKADIEALEQEFPVWVSDINNLDSALDMISKLGALTGKSDAAEKLAQDIKSSFESLSISGKSPRANLSKKAHVVYLIWNNPMMTIGKSTFIHDMLDKAGFKNSFKHLERYPEITKADLKTAKPDAVFLSSEPFPFKEKHIQDFQTLLPEAQIRLVDGELFSWYGSRLLYSAAYFKQLQLSVSPTQ